MSYFHRGPGSEAGVFGTISAYLCLDTSCLTVNDIIDLV